HHHTRYHHHKIHPQRKTHYRNCRMYISNLKGVFMKINTKELTLIALNTVFIACLAQITIPFGLVPFTLQVFAITLISFIYSLKITLFSVISYLTLGLLGLPFFNNMQSGMMMFFSPTIGFLLGF